MKISFFQFLAKIGYKWKNHKKWNFQNTPNMTFYVLEWLNLAEFPQKLGLDYSTLLENLNLIALEDRRPRGGLIQYYKGYSGTNIINWHVAPTTSTNNRTTRNSNPHCIVRPLPAKCSQREQSFTYRVIAPWNSLPHEIVESTSVNQFKNRLDKHLSLVNCIFKLP